MIPARANQRLSLHATIDPWSQARTRASNIVLDMLGAILDHDSQQLERLIVEDANHVNDPVGLPFDTPHSRFFGHPALNQMVILQHPDQTLLDIACGMPCGPLIWVLLSHGAKSSKHPLGTDLALHNAIKNGRPYTVQALLVPGRSDVNGTPGTTWNPLKQAVFWNVPDIVSILLSRGANTDDAGPSPSGPETSTALELCLQNRVKNLKIDTMKERGNCILRLLLDAGATYRVDAAQSAFDMFIEPWQTCPYWAMNLDENELHCLRHFMGQNARSMAAFRGFPCTAPSSETFEHQVLWHSTPYMAQIMVETCGSSPDGNGTVFLNEILGSCPNAKRHPADTLRDIQVLLQNGVDPNLADKNGTTPIRKVITECSSVDIVARLQVLLEGGADPEAEDHRGDMPYIVAARMVGDSLLWDVVLQVLISKMQGRSVKQVDSVSHTWAEGHFPISNTPAYDRVVSCAQKDGDFMINTRRMVPDIVQAVFQRAYFAVVSARYLATMISVAKSKSLDDEEIKKILEVVSMRKGLDLTDSQFDRDLILALLSSHPKPSTTPDVASRATVADKSLAAPTSGVDSRPASDVTLTDHTILCAHPWFQFNSKEPVGQVITTPPKQSESRPDDDFIASTTQIRWLNPCAKPQPGALRQATAAVLVHKCEVCNDGNLLTKRELKIHASEHAHTEACTDPDCTRRFCAVRRRTARAAQCLDHLFAD